jgi:hypothetical protein
MEPASHRRLLLASIVIGILWLPEAAGERHISAGKDAICAVEQEDNQGITCAGTDWFESKPGPFHGVATGDGFACGLSTSHKLSCWKRPHDADNSKLPTGVDTSTDFLDLAAGDEHVCGLKPNGEALCFPTGSSAAVGPNPSTARFISLSADKGVTCGITRLSTSPTFDGGEILCWSPTGATTSAVLTATKPAGPFIDVAVGENHACALSCNGTIAYWGDSAAYQPLLNKGNGKFVYLSAGRSDTCGIWEDVDGNRIPRCSSPVHFASSDHSIVEISVGERGVIALSSTPAILVSVSQPLFAALCSMEEGCTPSVGAILRRPLDGEAFLFPRATSATFNAGGVIDPLSTDLLGHGPQLHLLGNALVDVSLDPDHRFSMRFRAAGRCFPGVETLTIEAGASTLQLRPGDLSNFPRLRGLWRTGCQNASSHAMNLQCFDRVHSGIDFERQGPGRGLSGSDGAFTFDSFAGTSPSVVTVPASV